MRFPGIAYSFMRDTDTSGPTALILSRHFQLSGGALTVLEFVFSDLAKDRVLVLTNVTIRANPGAGQFVVQMRVQALSQGEENFNIDQREPLNVADQNEHLNWQGEVYIQGGGPGTDTVRVFAQFDSAANSNAITVGVHGIIIPRGNLGGFQASGLGAVSFDPTIGNLRTLAPGAQSAAIRMVTHVRLAGVPLIVTSALRNSSQQAELVRTGRSQTLRSKHLTGGAFDVDVHGFARTAIPRWWFYQLGSLAEPLGLRWGGNFRGFWDPGHFEDARAAR